MVTHAGALFLRFALKIASVVRALAFGVPLPRQHLTLTYNAHICAASQPKSHTLSLKTLSTHDLTKVVLK